MKLRTLDAILILALAAKIHASDKKMREVGARLLKLVPKSGRPDIQRICGQPSPCKAIWIVLGDMPDWMLTIDPNARIGNAV